MLYTAYQSPDSLEKIREFCAASGINVVTVPVHFFSEELVDSFAELGVKLLFHTVNEPKQAERLINGGVSGIYTDYLVP